MFNERTNRLEKRLIKVFGKNASLAVTNARVGNKGYLTRIESYGMPFKVDSYAKTIEESENRAFQKFEEEMEKSLKEKLFKTQKDNNYESYQLTKEEMEKLYKYIDPMEAELLTAIKKDTSAAMCKLENGLYECVINCSYMNLHARSTGATKRLAVAAAIWSAHDVLNPFPLKVGSWPLEEE